MANHKFATMDTDEIIAIESAIAESKIARWVYDNKGWAVTGMYVFDTTRQRAAVIAKLEAPTTGTQRPATHKQITYLKRLGVELEVGMSVERASQLIDGAKNEYLESIGGQYNGTTEASLGAY